MNKILDTTKYIIDHSENVKIDLDKVKEFAKQIKISESVDWWSMAPYKMDGLNDKDKLTFVSFLAMQSFCFWGTPKWAVNGHDGVYGFIFL